MTKQQIESVMCSILANVKFGTVPTTSEVTCYLEDQGIDATAKNIAVILGEFEWKKG